MDDDDDDLDVAEFERAEFESLLQRLQKHGSDHIHQLGRFSGEGYMHTYATSARILRVILQLGADVNQRDARKKTPLMYAVQSRHANVKATRILLDNHADLHLSDMHGNTAWDYAISKQRPSREILLLLLGRGGMPSIFFLPRSSDPIVEFLRVHINLITLCVPFSAPRFKDKKWLPRELIRSLRDYLS